MAVLLSLAASLSFGTSDWLGGRLSIRSHPLVVIAATQVAGLVGALALVFVVPGHPAGLAAGALAGLSGLVGLGFLYHGLATDRGMVVAPVSALVGAAVPVAVGMVQDGLPPRPVWLGLAGGMGSVLILGVGSGRTAESHTDLASLGMGAAAGVGFGMVLVCFSTAGGAAGLWPLVAARATTVPVVWGVVLLARMDRAGVRREAGRVGAVGMLEGVGSGASLLAATTGSLVVVGVLTSVYPAVTVALGWLTGALRPTRRQALGLAIAVGSMVPLALA